MLQGKTVIELAADLATGYVSADAIKTELGDGVLNSVLALAGGSIAGFATSKLLNAIEEETEIISDLGELVDDVFSIFD